MVSLYCRISVSGEGAVCISKMQLLPLDKYLTPPHPTLRLPPLVLGTVIDAGDKTVNKTAMVSDFTKFIF